MLAKAEILWTRRCPLKCSYCAMVDYHFAKAPLEKMLQGVDRLADQGCGFFAIYGSSPLWGAEFGGLPEFVRRATERGILTTVITDGIDKHSKDKLRILYEHGLRSLTCSFDGAEAPGNKGKPNHADKHVALKANRGLELVRWFRDEFDDLRDVALVATVHRDNWVNLLDWVPVLSDEGIWFLCDFLHADRGQPGTKCKGDGGPLLFQHTPADHAQLRQFAGDLFVLKQAGHRVHLSPHFLAQVRMQPSMVTNHTWKCNRGKNFPAWLTIDADGSVLPCDDFWTDRSLKVWDLDDAALETFAELYRAEVEDKCNGCAWSTHWDAVAIADSGKGFDEYVHLEGGPR